jgi:transmembrane protein TMEM260 (protein O-mannosyltransferase)
LGRIFTLFAFGDVSKVALMINIMSALSSSFTILFLFWTITMLAEKLMDKKAAMTNGKMYAILGSGLVGSLAFTFSDSFWFSAVEGEVYAMSSLFTAVVFWAILRWEKVADKRFGFRWLLLIAYLIGLSIGVHLLNLLAIPAIAYVYYFKKYQVTPKGLFATGIVSVLLLVVIMYIIIPWVVQLSGLFELLFVNSFGLPFNTGTIIYFILLIGGIVWGLHYTRKKGKVILNTIILGIVLILIGYSTFFILVIRSNANTPIDENSPEDAISLLSYLNREQYGTWPLVHGQYYNAPVDEYIESSPYYVKNKEKGIYEITGHRTEVTYDSKFETLFPRMWSNQKKSHISMYKQYGNVKGQAVRITKRDGSKETIMKPTFGENLRFFFSYQVGHMYLRYFMWNFAGRQNDIESQGELEHGNWISGIKFIDELRLGSLDEIPADWKNPAHNKFYFLPLILGLVGFFFQLNRSKKDTLVVFLLFFMTGLAIVVYLNQYPYQPRERDYAYTGSFYAFAIWMGLGVLGLTNFLKKYLKSESISAVIVILLTLVLVPGIMASQGWDDHNRSGKYAARDFAFNYLESCDQNGVLFTNGDNDTFPLWYAQEVEGKRTDLRVVNYMLSSGAWYVQQLGNKIYESEKLPFTLSPEQYKKGVNDQIPILNRLNERVNLKQLIEFVANDDERSKWPLQGGEKINFLPTKKVRLMVDSAKCIDNGIVPIELAGDIVPYIDWDISQNYLFKNDLMFLDFLASNNWERPIYFANPSSISKVASIDEYCHLNGIVYKFMPVKAKEYAPGVGGVDANSTYDILMNKAVWGELNDPSVTVDRESSRNSGIAKQNYLRLARALLSENKKDSAGAVIDKCLEFFPQEKFPYDLYMIPYADVYYEAGQDEKANAIVLALADKYRDDLIYIRSLDAKRARAFDQDMQQAYAILQRLSQMTRTNGQKELSTQMDSIFYQELEFIQQ